MLSNVRGRPGAPRGRSTGQQEVSADRYGYLPVVESYVMVDDDGSIVQKE
jgi:hypothetical protein